MQNVDTFTHKSHINKLTKELELFLKRETGFFLQVIQAVTWMTLSFSGSAVHNERWTQCVVKLIRKEAFHY